MTRARPSVVCVCCGKQGPLYGRGLIRACWKRHNRSGTLHQFPVDVEARLAACRRAAIKAGERRAQHSEGLMEDYAFLRSVGESREMLRLRVGISETTARKYERRLRADAGEVPAASPRREPRDVRLARVLALVVEHVQRWPGVLFSITSLAQSLASQLDCSTRTNWYDIRAVTEALVSEGVIEVVPGRWSYGPEGAARARRFRLATTSSQPWPPKQMEVAS